MTTLKISKKPADTRAEDLAQNAKKTPARRSSLLPRDRSKPPVKSQPAPHGEQHRQAAKAEPQRQRNHKHDGQLHEAKATPDSRAPASRNMQVDARRNDTTSRDRADREGNYRNPPRRGGKARDGFVASEFDKNRSNKTAFAAKVAGGESGLPRLSKVMADRGLCSRREADEWIANGWVK
ncbi:MAG: pseudouridine synthase, partial [Methylotenera sp.]